MEYPIACVKFENRCTCYTEQGTKIKEIQQSLCESYIADGLPFNPYKKQETQTVQNTQQTVTPQQMAQTEQVAVLELGGDPLPSLSPANSAHLKVIQ
ncbi:hypothetical protein [Wielerella bovis]|nr:hypothetical protein [Wielerella bovis]ULJ60121.1 hypothetical protein MIS44_10765 [Wielerella bovis]